MPELELYQLQNLPTSKIRISRMDLEVLATASNRTTYLPTHER